MGGPCLSDDCDDSEMSPERRATTAGALGTEKSGPYSGLRVLDLSDSNNLLCGKMLSDMGATVKKIDLDTVATSSPEESDEASKRRWLNEAVYNRGKECAILDLADASSLDRLLEWVSTSDVLIESGAPGSLRRYGLDYDALSARRPDLVYVSITPFGQTGPYSSFQSADITLQAMGGHLAVTGDADRPPLSIGVEVAYRHGGAEAASAASLAIYYRQRTGFGQHVDVSIQECIVWTLLNSTMTAQLLHRDDERGGALRKERGRDLLTQVIWPCKDGHVHFVPIGGGGGTARFRSYVKFVDWMTEEGFGDPFLHAREWNGKDVNSISQNEYDHLVALIGEFLLTKEIVELYDRAVKDRILLAPIMRLPDLLRSPQLNERGAFDELLIDDKNVRVPGRFAVMSGTPFGAERAVESESASRNLWTSPRRHRDDEIDDETLHQVFAGVKVADFTWAAAGPIITKCLADHGATVIRVESTTHPDSIRLGGPFKDGIPGLNRSGFFADFNTSKNSIALDMSTNLGRQIARRLVGWSDVVAESYTPGVMARFGLDYPTIRDEQPDLVMLSTCMQGQSGPYREYAGYGGQGAAIAGLHYVTGWPDSVPAGPKGAYTDSITPRFGIAALVAALGHRDRTGIGQHIDLSQIEASLQLLAPEILEYQLNGRVASPMGNRSIVHAPHGVYPCLGTDRWVAIAIERYEQFFSLAEVVGSPAWTNQDDLRTPSGRRARQDELDFTISKWTASRDCFAAMHVLQRAGIPAGAVQRPSDLLVDPQLKFNGHFWPLDHAELGTCLYNGPSFRLSRTPAVLRSSAPLLGQDTRWVLNELLDFSHAEIDDFAYAQVLG
jgi:crotonobetainyl-CoA:carnitine CoA-transferase CaiB-like acyl-CoA transferase